MATITVPKTERGVDGFIEKVHYALVQERDVDFRMDHPLAHTVATRILAEIDPPIPMIAPKTDDSSNVGEQLAIHPFEVSIRKTLISASGKRYRFASKTEIDKFKSDLEGAATSGRRIVFTGNHTVVARIYQSSLARRAELGEMLRGLERGIGAVAHPPRVQRTNTQK